MARMRIVLLMALLAGCGPTPEEIAAAHHAQCVELGLVPGSDQYADCRLTLLQIAEQRRASPGLC